MKSRKGMSPIIASIIMIGLVIIATIVVWTSVNTLVGDRISSSEACFGVFDKVTINDKFTCYNPSSNEVEISVIREDIELDRLIISVSDDRDSISSTIESENLPGKRGGKTYTISWDKSTTPTKIQIAPVINEIQCDASDSSTEIVDCDLI